MAPSTWCFFPIQRADREPRAQAKENELSSRKRVVIVIGDDLAVRNSLKFWLELEGLTVRSYASGVELLAADELGRCDCLVIDEKTPAISGLHLIAQLREHDFSAPAILVTSQPSMSLLDEAEKAGVPIVEKPLLGNGLLDTIRDAVAGKFPLA
jgi:FixJ family two-component response regulator